MFTIYCVETYYTIDGWLEGMKEEQARNILDSLKRIYLTNTQAKDDFQKILYFVMFLNYYLNCDSDFQKNVFDDDFSQESEKNNKKNLYCVFNNFINIFVSYVIKKIVEIMGKNKEFSMEDKYFNLLNMQKKTIIAHNLIKGPQDKEKFKILLSFFYLSLLLSHTGEESNFKDYFNNYLNFIKNIVIQEFLFKYNENYINDSLDFIEMQESCLQIKKQKEEAEALAEQKKKKYLQQIKKQKEAEALAEQKKQESCSQIKKQESCLQIKKQKEEEEEEEALAEQKKQESCLQIKKQKEEEEEALAEQKKQKYLQQIKKQANNLPQILNLFKNINLETIKDTDLLAFCNDQQIKNKIQEICKNIMQNYTLQKTPDGKRKNKFYEDQFNQEIQKQDQLLIKRKPKKQLNQEINKPQKKLNQQNQIE